MSLLGVDMGSSSVKVSAYTEDGQLLAGASREIRGLHPQPGWWETDPEDVWRATRQSLAELGAAAELRRDPPKALAISASGRENFPADADGRPLGNALMGADVRGAEFEMPEGEVARVEPWMLSCGHLRERMDPVMRLLWWRSAHPEIMDQARSYPDWHGFLTWKLCGRNVSERSLTGRWAAYDLATRTWSPDRLAEYAIEHGLLPEVLEWGEPIGPIRPELAREWGLPTTLMIVTGGHDLNCAGIGVAASRLGAVCLISGSYENMLIPTAALPTESLLLRGLSITPHFGRVPLSIYAICPTGNAVLNWARETVGLSIDEMTRALETQGAGPSPVMAVPAFSGLMLHGPDGRRLRGALLGLTLATTREEIVRAFMESIAYDDAATLALLREERVLIDLVRATGGGTRAPWWTQLKADVMGIPIEVAAAPEPGTLGAALLAGIGVGVFADLDEASATCSGTGRVYEPDLSRAALHQERLAAYQAAVPHLLHDIYRTGR